MKGKFSYWDTSVCESVNCGINLLLSSRLCHWQLCELEQVMDLLMSQFTHLENGDKIEQTSSGCQEDETRLCKVLGAYPWHIGSLSKGLLSLLVQTSFLQAVYNFFPHLNIRRMIQNFLLSLDQKKQNWPYGSSGYSPSHSWSCFSRSSWLPPLQSWVGHSTSMPRTFMEQNLCWWSHSGQGISVLPSPLEIKDVFFNK